MHTTLRRAKRVNLLLYTLCYLLCAVFGSGPVFGDDSDLSARVERFWANGNLENAWGRPPGGIYVRLSLRYELDSAAAVVGMGPDGQPECGARQSSAIERRVQVFIGNHGQGGANLSPPTGTWGSCLILPSGALTCATVDLQRPYEHEHHPTDEFITTYIYSGFYDDDGYGPDYWNFLFSGPKGEQRNVVFDSYRLATTGGISIIPRVSFAPVWTKNSVALRRF